MYPKLNLPPFDPRLEENDGRLDIWDVIRKKMIALTPEEWVRQHVVHLLTAHLNYGEGLIKVESQMDYWRKTKRSDIVTYDQNGTPYLLIECKSWKQSINNSTLAQISTYNKILEAPYIAVSNGMHHFCWAQEKDQYKQLKEFPPSPAV